MVYMGSYNIYTFTRTDALVTAGTLTDTQHSTQILSDAAVLRHAYQEHLALTTGAAGGHNNAGTTVLVRS